MIYNIQYRKNTHPDISINEIRAIHTSTNLRGFRVKSFSVSFSSNYYLLELTIHLLKQTAIHIIITMATEPAEKGNI